MTSSHKIEEDKSHLIQQIKDAFKGSQYPSKGNIVFNADDWEGAEVESVFAGKHWKEVTLEVLLSHSGAIWFLSPEAYRFYLPAYLIASLDDEADIVFESTISSLAPSPHGIGSISSFKSRLEKLNDSQRKAIRSFLEFVAGGEPDYPYGVPVQKVIQYWVSSAY